MNEVERKCKCFKFLSHSLSSQTFLQYGLYFLYRTTQSYLAWICCLHPANDFMYEYVEAILLIIQESHQIKEYRVTITDDFVQSSLAVKLYQFNRPPFHTQNKEIALALKKSLVNSKYGYKPLYPVKHRRQNKKTRNISSYY